MSAPRKERNAPTFEAALNRLEEIVGEMENADLPLEDILQRYEEGVKLRDFCESRLKEAELRVEKITPGPDGRPASEPFDPADTE